MGSLSATDLNDTCEDYVSGTVFQEIHSSDEDIMANSTILTSLTGNDTEMYF